MTGLVGIAASLGDIEYRYTPNDIDETHILTVLVDERCGHTAISRTTRDRRRLC